MIIINCVHDCFSNITSLIFVHNAAYSIHELQLDLVFIAVLSLAIVQISEILWLKLLNMVVKLRTDYYF